MSRVAVTEIDLEDWDGPWVGAAGFCESVLIESNGVQSVIRFFDILTVDPPPPSEDEIINAIHLDLKLYILLRSGTRAKDVQVSVRQHSPFGPARSTPQEALHLPGEAGSVPLQIRLGIDVPQEGQHWFDILVDDLIVSRVPLRIRFRAQHSIDTADIDTADKEGGS